MNYHISKNTIHIPSDFGLIQIPMRLGLDAHKFARRYTKLLAGAIEDCDKTSLGLITTLLDGLGDSELDELLSDVFKGARLDGAILDIQQSYLPLDATLEILLIILSENCKPVLTSKFEPSRVVQGLKKQASSASSQNRSIENVKTSYLSEIKLMILGLANSDYNGGHTYQYFLDECPLQTFYDLLEYKNISESVQIESQHISSKLQQVKKR